MARREELTEEPWAISVPLIPVLALGCVMLCEKYFREGKKMKNLVR